MVMNDCDGDGDDDDNLDCEDVQYCSSSFKRYMRIYIEREIDIDIQ